MRLRVIPTAALVAAIAFSAVGCTATDEKIGGDTGSITTVDEPDLTEVPTDEQTVVEGELSGDVPELESDGMLGEIEIEVEGEGEVTDEGDEAPQD
jgi:hypothetical protein